ncbi:MAG: peptidyl-prolyl cis-trans isomerase [Elusimicrobiota bacterium]
MVRNGLKQIFVMILKSQIIIFIMLLVFSSGCKRREDIVAYVGSRKITSSEFKRRIKELPDYYLGFISTEGGKRQYLSGIIKEEVLLQKCENLNVHKRPEVIQRLKDAKREILLASVMDYLQREVIRISDQEVRDNYEENKENFLNPEQIKVSHILLSDEKTAKEVMTELSKRVSFEKLANEYSIDTITAISGGDLGYFGRGEMLPPEFEKEVFSLKKVGDISDIIKTPFGYHIAQLTGRRRGREKSFEEAKEEIGIRLEKEKFNSVIEQYRGDYNVKVNYEVLDDIKLTEEDKEEKENE